LAAFAPDVIVVAAFGLILPQAVLDLPRFGCINVHASILPRHRGAAPIAAAILAGDVTTGVTIMLMDAGVDTGPALSAAYLPIAPEDTTGSLTAKLAELGAHQLLRTLPRWLAGDLFPISQLEEGATYAPRIEKEEGRIDWSETAVLIARKVRAFQPWPSAYTTWDGRMLKVLGAHAGPGQGVLTTVIPGDGRSAGVVTGDGVLWLDEVQLAGKKPAAIDAFLAGARGFVGSKLG